MDVELAEAVKRVRVVVVDDQQIVREGIAGLLHADAHIEVAGQGENGQEAIELVAALDPEVVLLDIRMPVMDGLEAIHEIKSRWPGVRIVILTSYAYDGYVLEGLMAGADGYLLKDATPASLVSGIIAVAEGQQVMEPRVARHVTELLGKQSSKQRQQYDGLTARELQALAMMARGLVAKEIAHELRISEKTVRNHISNIYHKLGVFDRSQIVLYAIRKGIVSAE